MQGSWAWETAALRLRPPRSASVRSTRCAFDRGVSPWRTARRCRAGRHRASRCTPVCPCWARRTATWTMSQMSFGSRRSSDKAARRSCASGWAHQNRSGGRSHSPSICRVACSSQRVATSIRCLTETVLPAWSHRLGLNWLVRLFREPRRLWRRVFFGTGQFIINTVRWVVVGRPTGTAAATAVAEGTEDASIRAS